MAKKILKALTNNIVYKILALLLACVLWVIVYNSDDPTITRTYTTNVTVTNESVLSELNKCYEIIEGTNTVSFAVTGARSYLDKLEDTDFTATADMSRIVMDESNDTATVPIEITSRNYSRYISFGNTKYLKVSLEDLQSKQLVIDAVAVGEVAEGYALGDVSVTAPTVLKVSGPASIVGRVERVVAQLDVDGMSLSFSFNVVPVLYDADGKVIDTTRLTLSNSTVTVSAKILNQKTVSVLLGTTGTPAEGYQVTGISCSPEKISVKGPSGVLNALTAIEIPSDVLNVDGASSNIETTVDITEYLPEGVELVDESQRIITIDVTIEGMETKNITLNTSDIVAEGLSEDLQVSYPQDRVVIRVIGLRADLEQITDDMISAAIDLTGYGTGTFSVPIKIQLDENTYTIQNANTYVMITAKNAPDVETDTSAGQNDSSAGSEADTQDQPEEGDTSSSEGT